MGSRWHAVVFVCCVLALAVVASRCKDDGAAGNGGSEPDTVTSATPQLVASALGEGHPGWGDAGCASCHESVHNRADFVAAECASCHGSNGAPSRGANHPDEGCAGCHVTSHTELAFESPTDCIGCHRYAATGGDCAATLGPVDAVVVGAGGGGLAAAAELALNGMDVVVLEKHFRVGGYMANFRRGDYRFEVSLHGFSGLDNEELFRSLDIWDRVEPVRVDPLYAVHLPGGDYTIPADIDEYEARLKEWFPDEAQDIDDLFREIENLMEVYAIVQRYMAEGRDVSDLDVQLEMIQEASELGLLQSALRLQRLASGETLGDFLAEFVSDPGLIAVWTRLAGFVGLEPDEMSGFYFLVMWNSYHNDGWYYFRGGSQAVSDALAEVVEENGGRIRLHSLVTDIVVEDGRATTVRTDDGLCVETRYVVSNANAPATLLDLVGLDELPAVDEDSPFHPSRLEPGHETSLLDSLSAITLNLGVDREYRTEFGDAHEIFVAETLDQNENFEWMRQHDVEHAEYIVCDYTRLDPTMAPEDHSVLGLVTLIDLDWQDLWHLAQGHEAYQSFKEEVGATLVERLERDLLPDLRDHIEVIEVASPATMRGFTLNRGGAIYGWLHTPEQSLLDRMPQQTPIENLVLAGAWTFPGGGQSAVLSSGQTAAQMILSREEDGSE